MTFVPISSWMESVLKMKDIVEVLCFSSKRKSFVIIRPLRFCFWFSGANSYVVSSHHSPKFLFFFVAILSQHFVCLNNIRRMISLHYFWEGIVFSIFVCGRNQRILYKLAMKTFLHWKQKVLISLAVLQTEIRQSTQWTNCAVISRSHYFWIQVIFNPLAPKIWLSILPCTCFNFQVN